VAAAVTGVGALLLMVQTDSGFARWDKSFGRMGLPAHATEASARFMRDVSMLGGTTLTVALAVVVARRRDHPHTPGRQWWRSSPP